MTASHIASIDMLASIQLLSQLYSRTTVSGDVTCKLITSKIYNTNSNSKPHNDHRKAIQNAGRAELVLIRLRLIGFDAHKARKWQGIKKIK